MGVTKNSKSRIFWIIILLCSWISCCDSSRIQNLRWNQDEKKCMSELVSRGLLTDDQFRASSHFENKTIFQARMARLIHINSQSSTSDGRAWCPSSPVHKNLTEWIEVDFRRMVLLSVIYTMGRGDGNFKEFTPQIVIKYQRSDSGSWFIYHDKKNLTIQPLNSDSRTTARITLQTIVVKRIRIFPLATETGPKFVCLKIAFLGCYFNDEIMSYTAPQGDQGLIQNSLIDLRDHRYDGTKSNDLLHGLGILTNNIAYIDEAGVDHLDSRNMAGLFMGWRCIKDRVNKPINISFFYEHERVFSQISIFYTRKESDNLLLTSPISVYIGYDNVSLHHTYNETIYELSSVLVHESQITIPLNQARGSFCTLSITCGQGNWIVLSEVEIISMKSTNNKNTDVTKLVTVPPQRKDFRLLIAIGFAIIIVLTLFSCIGFLYYKMRMLRQDKLNKNLELVAKCGDHIFSDPSGTTVFTMQSKHQSISSMTRCKQVATNTYAGSQPSDGVYASWPNTDEETDVANIDREEEKCLLGTDLGADTRSSSNGDYAVYQPGGVTFSGSGDYYHSSRPPSTFLSGSIHSTLSERLPLSVSHLKIVSLYDLPKSTPTVTFRNNSNTMSFQHLMHYRGICGDVDLRYQSTTTTMTPTIRPDHTQSQYHHHQHHHCQPVLDSHIKIVSTTSIILVQPWVRGQFGCIDLVTVALNNNDTGRYFIRKLNHDAPAAIKSMFILDLKILSILNSPTVSRLAAIVVDSDIPQENVADVIRCGQFCILMEHNDCCNLKDFLRSSYYHTNQSHNYKTSTLSSHSQINISSMLHIITQISGALRHLEELGLTHRDVGCRNCTIDSRKLVKLYPGGYVTTQPFEDYCTIELQKYMINFPLRWLAPESISKGIFTCKSDVWSFGVAMWEVFTLCSLQPYPSLTNEALLELMSDRDHCPRLSCPQNCPRELYDLMCQCWCWDESLRPTFVDVNLFLQIKAAGATTQTQFILPAPPPLLIANDGRQVTM